MGYYDWLKKNYSVAMDETLHEHDEKEHGGHYDPQTMTCRLRDDLESDMIDSGEQSETPKLDAEYMDAVKRGDMETAREMALDALTKNIKPTTSVEARWIQPVNGIQDTEKYNNLVEDFKKNGWRGRPIVAWNDDGDHWVAFTGSHRIAAAEEAGIEVPVYEIPNEAIQGGYDALEEAGESGDDLISSRDDYDRSLIFQRMVDEFGINDFSTPAKILNMESSIDNSVTYDDSGNPIPLSKRFDLTNPDIRY